MKTGGKESGNGTKSQQRQQLAAALRDNLKRRKKQPSPTRKQS